MIYQKCDYDKQDVFNLWLHRVLGICLEVFFRISVTWNFSLQGSRQLFTNCLTPHM